MDNSQEIARRIKSIAQKKKVLIKDMLSELSMNVNTISMLSKGREISYVNFAKIADYLNVSVDYLLGRAESPDIKSITPDMTDNEAEITKLFKDLTMTQQGEIIGRAKVMAESNTAAKKPDITPKGWAIPPVESSKAVARDDVDTFKLKEPPVNEENFVKIPSDEL